MRTAIRPKTSAIATTAAEPEEVDMCDCADCQDDLEHDDTCEECDGMGEIWSEDDDDYVECDCCGGMGYC